MCVWMASMPDSSPQSTGPSGKHTREDDARAASPTILDDRQLLRDPSVPSCCSYIQLTYRHDGIKNCKYHIGPVPRPNRGVNAYQARVSLYLT
jgi:hypothetical protein